MIITIEPGDLPNLPPGMEPEIIYNEDVIEEFGKKTVLVGGLVTVVYWLIAISKGVITWVIKALIAAARA